MHNQGEIEQEDKMKMHRASTAENDAQPSEASVSQFSGSRYRANLERVRELMIEANEFGLVWGVMRKRPEDDGEFKLRLLQRANNMSNQQELPVKCVEVSRESLKTFCFHVRKIRSLMQTHDKAIIFQNIDIQVYVMEDMKEEGFCVHFQDKKRSKVSLSYEHFLRFISALPRLNRDYMRYKKELRIKRNRQMA